jgi:hypothetical protein
MDSFGQVAFGPLFSSSDHIGLKFDRPPRNDMGRSPFIWGKEVDLFFQNSNFGNFIYEMVCLISFFIEIDICRPLNEWQVIAVFSMGG